MVDLFDLMMPLCLGYITPLASQLLTQIYNFDEIYIFSQTE